MDRGIAAWPVGQMRTPPKKPSWASQSNRTGFGRGSGQPYLSTFFRRPVLKLFQSIARSSSLLTASSASFRLNRRSIPMVLSVTLSPTLDEQTRPRP